jgi:uncharacterized protein (DUF169 family)
MRNSEHEDPLYDTFGVEVLRSIARRSIAMMDYFTIETRLCEILDLSRRPVAVTFSEAPPAGITKFAGEEPSGCSFWQLAAGGMTFYTVPHDHRNCAVGCYAHNFPLPAERAGELERAFSQMTSSGYIKMEEISSIPRMKQAPQAVIYSPLGNTPTEPDLVIFVTRPMQAMVLQEAALRTGAGLQLSAFGRPTCMSLPTVLNQDMVTSAGCLANRVYTGLADDELYVLVPGKILQNIAEAVQGIADSNEKITEYHRARRKSLGIPME